MHSRKTGGWEARPSRAAYLDEARKICNTRGGELISNEYISAKSKLAIRCERNHEFAVTADNIKHGRWCPECKRRAKQGGWRKTFVEWLSYANSHAINIGVTVWP